MGKEKAMNQEIKSYAKEKGVKLWQVADELKITDGQLSRKLRYELPESEREQILSIIDLIAEDRK